MAMVRLGAVDVEGEGEGEGEVGGGVGVGRWLSAIALDIQC